MLKRNLNFKDEECDGPTILKFLTYVLIIFINFCENKLFQIHIRVKIYPLAESIRSLKIIDDL